MNSQEAKHILTLYRPGNTPGDGEFAEALEQVQRETELRRWFELHCAFQTAMRDKLRQLPVPPHLQTAVLAQDRIIRPGAWWPRSVWLAAAAIVLGLGLAFWWFQERRLDRFDDYRARMVRAAQRQYRMDIETNNLAVVRQFLGERGAPSDFVLPNELERLSLSGGGLLQWRGHRVSMVCFDRGDKQMLFLFIVDRGVVKQAPPTSPQVGKVNRLMTASWTRGNRAYLLAGPDDPEPFRSLK